MKGRTFEQWLYHLQVCLAGLGCQKAVDVGQARRLHSAGKTPYHAAKVLKG